MLTREQALSKIQALLALGDKTRNNSDEEAERSILKAQELMAKYNISLEEASEEKGPEYDTKICESKWDYAFRVPLAQVLAKNFRCEVFLQNKKIAFMGHKMDAEICKSTFEFAYQFIMRRGNQEYNRRYELGYKTKGVFNSYAQGFIVGLKRSLDAQCIALAIITPPDVTQKFKEMSKNWETRKSRMGDATDNETFLKGLAEGQEFLNKKAIEK